MSPLPWMKLSGFEASGFIGSFLLGFEHDKVQLHM